MRPITRIGVALAIAIPVGVSNAQTPCAVSRAQVDSAKSELQSVLSSGGTVVEEIKVEQRLPNPLPPMALVQDGIVCARLATAFGHSVNKGDTFVVLRVGPIYYARDPYQRRGTGIITDSAYKVLARLGVPIK